MSTHPNAILMVVFTPDELARKTYRSIFEDHKTKTDDKLQVGNNSYHGIIMEEDYNRDFQITAPEGSIVFFDHITYGFGEVVSWDDLVKQKETLETWAKMVCETYKCSYKMFVSANYW